MSRILESVRPFECVACGERVRVTSATTAHAEAPEMLGELAAGGVGWIGLVAGDHAPEIIVVCTRRECLEALLCE